MAAMFTSRRLRRLALGSAALPLALLMGAGSASAQTLATFAVLAGSTVTNTGPTVINGNLGLSPGTAITGFPPGVVTAPYAIYNTDAVAAQAQSDLTAAYNVLAARPSTANLSGQDLGGMVLQPGVYSFDTSAQLTGTLTFDAAGDPNAVFVVNIGSTLTTAAASSVVLVNGAQAINVYFRVGSSATLNAATMFQGNILALSSITLITGSTIECGSALARNGAVTLDTNIITVCVATAGVPGLDDLAIVGGALPLSLQVLSVLTPEELAIALSQLSGETATGVAPAAFQAMSQFMALARGDRGPGVVSITSDDIAPETVSVMGYAADPAPLPAFAGIDGRHTGRSDAALWEIWAAVYGGYSRTPGVAATRTQDLTIRNFGFATGIDYRVGKSGTIGLTAGAGATNFQLSGNRGDGRSQVFEVALYGRKDFERAYISGALGYAFHTVATNRYVTFAGFDHFTAAFNANHVAAEIEAGYHVGVFTPYAAVRGQALFLPAYGETTQTGNAAYALNYGAQTARTVRTEVGVKVDWMRVLVGGNTLGLHGKAAWAHDFYAGMGVPASFQAIPGSGFTATGAMAAADSLLLSAGTDIAFVNGVSFGASVNGELSQSSRSLGGSVKFGYRW